MNVKAALVIIAFKRPKTLNLVLESVSAALVPEYQRIIFVQQGKNEEVSSLIKSFNYLPSQYLNYERTEAKSPEQAINANVYRGVAAAFENRDINLVTVLEDDILIAKDFLKFNLEICKTHYLDPAFRGINGFSGIPRSTSNCVTYSKQRFGTG